MSNTTLQKDPGTLLAEDIPPMTFREARFEAERCLYCFDAPCMQACPTHIDIPGFIRKIAQDRSEDAGRRILRDNLLGATCSRVCPVKELCEGACVRNDIDQPVQIGRLQRHATDAFTASGALPFVPPAPTGRGVAVVGSGPAGLGCAGELARMGHRVTVFERRDLPGGLSTHGIIPLREPADVALAEVDMIRRLGVTVETGRELGRNLSWDELEEGFDAVFLAIGLGAVPLLGVPGDHLVRDGIAFLEESKRNGEVEGLGDHVVVIGAGNTAIDCATMARRMGVNEVTILYRRGEADMSAYRHEYEFALREGIGFSFMVMPDKVFADHGRVTGLACRETCYADPGEGRPGSVVPRNDATFTLACDTVIAAIGQVKPLAGTDTAAVEGLKGDRDYLEVDDAFMTSRPGVFAGGDCIRARGDATTVMAVQDGKMAARAIHAWLEAKKE